MILPVTAGGCLQRHPREILCVLLKKDKTPRTVFNDMCEENANPHSLFFFSVNGIQCKKIPLVLWSEHEQP